MDSLVAFESLTEKEKRRELRRRERNAILAKAEGDFRKKEEKKKQAELRGEGSWMLPSVEDRINNEQKEIEDVLRKKDKKKNKKDKKSKHKKKHHRSSSASDSEKDSALWVEKTAGNERNFGPKLERDSWMTEEVPFASSLVPSSRREKTKPKEDILETAGQHRLELNPFWKGGGSGLPDAAAAVPLTGTGDGGLSWLRKALQRCQEAAKEENRSVEEVAAERYGSLKDLKKRIKDAEEKHGEEQRRPRLNFRRPMDEDDSSDRYQRRRDPEKIPEQHSRWRKKTESSRHSESRERHRKGDVKEPETKLEVKTSSSEESDDEKNEEESKKPESCERVLTEKEINEIGAKLIKAELLGDEDLAKQLKEQLESSRKVRDTKIIASKVKSSEGAKEDVAMLLRTDRQGLTRPLPGRQYPVEPLRGRGKKKLTTTHEGVKRTKYFDDDEKYSLKDLVEREKLSTTEDSNMLFARLAGRNVQGDDEDMDDKMVDKAAMKQSVSLMESREKQLAIIEHKKMSSSLEKCHRCFDNVSKHLLVAVGLKVYLALPHHESMADGHCLIVPITHEVQSTRLDEDVWEEVKIFRKGLTRMFKDSGRDCVFMETSINLKKYPHMVIECVPMPKEVGEMAPIYFKKALDECEGEWADNKKIVDLRNKDVRQAVPKGFPYFTVSFGLEEGYAHIVEDERSFPSYFGREVVGGMLELESSIWRRPHKESFEKQRQKVLKFATEWKDYDWTVKLKSA